MKLNNKQYENMNTQLKNFLEIGKLVDGGDKNEIITYIAYLDSRVRDLDLQLRQISNCCQQTVQQEEKQAQILNTLK